MSEENTKSSIRKVNISNLNFRGRGKPKIEKTPSLFDSKIEDRNYWGNDPGTDLEIALTRIEIRKSLNNGKMLDIKNFPKASHLSQLKIMELMEYQLHFMTIIADENDCNIFANINNDGFVMVEIDNTTNKYNFVLVK